jgi:hypothetical protein
MCVTVYSNIYFSAWHDGPGHDGPAKTNNWMLSWLFACESGPLFLAAVYKP